MKLLKDHNRSSVEPEGCLGGNTCSAWATNVPCAWEVDTISGSEIVPKKTVNLLFKGGE